MPEQTPSTERQSGLPDNAAGGLSYVAVIPAVIFLLLEPYNRSPFIRFHAWQCIYMTAAWLVIELLIGIVARFSPFVALIAVGLYPLLALAMIILWIMLLLKALNGERYKLPIIGELADSRAGRNYKSRT